MTLATSRSEGVREGIAGIVRQMLREQESELLARVEQAMKERERRVAEVIGEDSKTHLERVRDALLLTDRPLTVRQLSEATGLDTSAVRLVLYTKTEHFWQATNQRPSRWCLKAEEVIPART